MVTIHLVAVDGEWSIGVKKSIPNRQVTYVTRMTHNFPFQRISNQFCPIIVQNTATSAHQ
jgi:hypothetical protein